jgi:ABC-2 type transport system ATP-binding protein
MNDQSIVIDHLSKNYRDIAALDNLTLQVKGGELFGLLGPNGAGKTTAISILCGLVKPTNGTATVCGYDVVKESAKVKNLIGVCTQETAVYPYLTGTENVDLFGSLYCLDGITLNSRRDQLLSKMGLIDDAKRKAGKYSGGMKRRLSLILALINNPQVAFLDEPTVAMDPQSRHAVWDFLKELKEEEKTIILTTHYMEEAEELCDRVGIIDHGKLISIASELRLPAAQSLPSPSKLPHGRARGAPRCLSPMRISGHLL